MATYKRPNPAVAVSERLAASTEAMVANASEKVPAGLDRLAKRRRATANKIKSRSPYLHASEE